MCSFKVASEDWCEEMETDESLDRRLVAEHQRLSLRQQ